MGRRRSQIEEKIHTQIIIHKPILSQLVVITMTIFTIVFILISLTKGESQMITKKMFSEVLNKEVKYNVYYPKGYSTDKQYPIIYGLHGMGWNYTYYNVSQPSFDQAIEKKLIDPFILVCPDALNSFFINTFADDYKFEDFFITEFIPHVEQTENVISSTTHRALFGISMGGFGTTYYSLKYQEMFSVAVAMSPALMIDDYNEILNICKKQPNTKFCFQSKVVFQIFGDEERYLEYNVNSMLKSHEKGTFKTPLYACVGKQDYLFDYIIQARDNLLKYHDNVVYDLDDIGDHEEWYWFKKAPKALKFIQDHWKSNSRFFDSNQVEL